MASNTKKVLNSKKWVFGKLFHRKQNVESVSSSDENQKEAFKAQKQHKLEKGKQNKKGLNSDCIVVSPKKNEFFLPFKEVKTNRSMRSPDRQTLRDRKQFIRLSENNSSSEDDRLKSFNLTPVPRYRSDDSLGSSGVSTNRKSRAARNKRYYKNINRDCTLNDRKLDNERRKTQPIEMINPKHQPMYNLNYSLSLSDVHGHADNHSIRNKTKHYPHGYKDKKSNDNCVHISNINYVASIRNPTPPPPPRDPYRRLQPTGYKDLRPISYAYDKNLPNYCIKERCVSDDKLWGLNKNVYPNTKVQRPSSTQPISQQRRFIARGERDHQHYGVPTGSDCKYVTDIESRSRRPLYFLQENQSQLQTPPAITRPKKEYQSLSMNASNFWKKIDEQEVSPRGRKIERNQNKGSKLRSHSSSQIGETNIYQINGNSCKNHDASPNRNYEIENSIISGSLYIKPTKDNTKNLIEVRSKPFENKSSSMPNYYQQYQREFPKTSRTLPPSQYDIYVNKRLNENSVEKRKGEKNPPMPPQRRSSKLSSDNEYEKPTNLEDAINELEAIYKNLILGDENLTEEGQNKAMTTGCATKICDEYDNNTNKHIALNDRVERSSNLLKNGIPITSIPSSSKTDYLDITREIPQKQNCDMSNPIRDDIAIQISRKQNMNTTDSLLLTNPMKKQKALRSNTTNIYNIIPKGDLKSFDCNRDYFKLNNPVKKTGSCSDVHNKREDNKILSSLFLKPNVQIEDENSNSRAIYRHSYEGGDIFKLPSAQKNNDVTHESSSTLKITPFALPHETMHSKSRMEDVLNQIAKEAKESSEKLSRDLIKLRKESNTLLKNSNFHDDNMKNININNGKEELSETGELNKHISQNPAPQQAQSNNVEFKIKKSQSEDKLLKTIDDVGENAKESVTNNLLLFDKELLENSVKTSLMVEPKISEESSDVASLIEKIDPNSGKMSEIVSRCMTQINELSDLKDEIIVHKIDEDVPKLAPLAAYDDDDADAEIYKIMKDCGEDDGTVISKQEICSTDNKTPISSSDYHKSSSVTPSRRTSSSITSIHAFSSSEYIKSPSSEFNQLTTDAIKTLSTTSYEVDSSSITPYITTSPLSTTSSPLFDLTPVGNDVNSPERYNSSEELAIIFGINEVTSPPTRSTTTNSAGSDAFQSLDLENNLTLTTANKSCQSKNHNLELKIDTKEIPSIKNYQNQNSISVNNTSTQIIGNSNQFSSVNKSQISNINNNEKEIENESLGNVQALGQLGEIETVIFSYANFKPAKLVYNLCSDSRPISALYDIICKEKESEIKNMNNSKDDNAVQCDIVSDSSGDSSIKLNVKTNDIYNSNIKNQLPMSNAFRNTNILNSDISVGTFNTTPCDNSRIESSLSLKSSSLDENNYLDSELETSNTSSNNLKNEFRKNLNGKEYERIKQQRRKTEDLNLISKNNLKYDSGDMNECVCNISLSGLKRRYITRSSPASSDSSSSSSKKLSNSNRLKSPLKSPSKCFSPKPQILPLVSCEINPLQNLNVKIPGKSKTFPCDCLYNQHLLSTTNSLESNRTGENVNYKSTLSGTHNQLSPNTAQTIRTTKTSRLRAAAVDKKSKDNKKNAIRSAMCYSSMGVNPDTNKAIKDDVTSPTTRKLQDATDMFMTGTVSMKHGEISNNGSPNASVSLTIGKTVGGLISRDDHYPISKNMEPECSLTIENISKLDDEHIIATENDSFNGRTSTTNSNSSSTTSDDIELTPISLLTLNLSKNGRDKSSKRKSNLNRALNEESTQEGDAALRRRRRRELGMARQLIPSQEISAAIKDIISPLKYVKSEQKTLSTPTLQSDVSYPTIDSRKEVLSQPLSDHRRANTASPKLETDVKIYLKLTQKTPEKCESVPITRSIEKENQHIKRNARLSDVARKVDAMRERTQSELAEIEKITAKCNISVPKSKDENIIDDIVLTADNTNVFNNINKKNVKKERNSVEDKYKDVERVISLLPYRSEENRQRNLSKALSHDKELFHDISSFIPAKLSPILRRKSSEDQYVGASNHIVSILKKKDNAESSSASSNASPVTFSSSVVDTPIRNLKRQGILKKRSSLDECRYSRSHSPDEKSILIKTARRNSLEEIQHGILKQSSYESKSDGCPSVEPQSILKKKDSISTPSDNHSKHVSISEAVILAAAELCKDIMASENDYDIKPILKTDNTEMRTPKPILKKKHSFETEGIRPILKTSRKSSREEASDNDDCVRPILKNDSPGNNDNIDQFQTNLVLHRSKSFEYSNKCTEDSPREKPTERVRSMEKNMTVLGNSANISSGTVPKISNSNIKRDVYRGRFKTQPITVNELNCAQHWDIYKPSSLQTLNTSTKMSLQNQPSKSISNLDGDMISGHFMHSVLDPNCSAFQKVKSLHQNSECSTDDICVSDLNISFEPTKLDAELKSNTCLTRKNSVQTRPNMYQQLDEQLKETKPDKKFSEEPKKGILKSNSKTSTENNLKSEPDILRNHSDSLSDSDEDGVDPEKNLAKILRSVSKENMHKHQNQHLKMPSEHGDTLCLVRNLSNFDKEMPETDLNTTVGVGLTSSGGESSGGREISSIIKNSDVARRRKLNEG